MNSGPEVLAVIPARGGSKGIPRKNLIPVGGVPLVARAIATARGAKLVSRVIVSTDAPEISLTSRRWGAEVIERPADISGDDSSSEFALLHALEHLERTEGYRPAILVFLQCTSPLTVPEDVDGVISALLEKNADCALTAALFDYFLWREDEKEGAVGINHDKSRRLRRQDRTGQFLETGAVYAMRTQGFLESRHRFFGKIALHLVDPGRALEIDNPWDLVLAEAMVRSLEGGETRGKLPEKIAALVMDFDGVFTDNRVWVDEEEKEAVACHRGDGAGLDHLKRSGLPLLVLSSEKNPVVAARCRKLGIECRQDIREKREAMLGWARERGLDPVNIVYLGNDLNDLGCMAEAGCAVAVADAHPKVKAAARIILQAPGGRGAIRELAELIGSKLGREMK